MTAPSRRELWGANLSTWVCAYGKVPTVNPSVKNQRFLPAPFSKGACGQWPLTISHDSFQRFVTSLTRPVTLPSKMGSENMGTMHVLTAVAHRPARYRRLVRRTYSLFTLHYSLKTPGIVTLQKAWFHTSLREGGGLGRSPKTEGASGRKGDWTAGGGTSPGLSGF